MKKTIFLSLFTLLSVWLFAQSNGTTIDCSELPQKPIIASAVNDYANIIDDATQANLEAKLREYWNSTTIAVTVFTMQSIDGEVPFEYSLALFNCWGVGDKTNRGVLIFISIEERAVEIRTGTGIEFIMTDIMAKRIIENNIIPSFKTEDYSKGIVEGVNGVIGILGTMSWEDRMAQIKEREEIEARERAQQQEKLMNFIFTILFIACFLGIIYLIYKWNVRREKRKIFLKLHKSLSEEIIRARKSINDIVATYEFEPSWAKKESREHQNIIAEKLAEADAGLVKANGLYRKDPESAVESAGQVDIALDKAFENFKILNVKLKAKIKKFSDEASVKHANACVNVGQKKMDLKKLIDVGFTSFQDELNELSEIETKLLGYNGAFMVDKENHKTICDQSDLLQSKAVEINSVVMNLFIMHNTVEVGYKELRRKCESLYEKKNSYENLLSSLKIYHKDVWKEFDKKISTLFSLISPAALDRTLLDITLFNSLKLQKFDEAHDKYQALANVAQTVPMLFSEMEQEIQNQKKAEEDVPVLSIKAKEAVDKALAKVKDSDVESATRSLAKKASDTLRSAHALSESRPAHWIKVIFVYDQAISEAEAVIKQAENDIDEAEKKRKRKREEEEEERQRRNNSYNNSGSFGGFGGSGGGGGFGGFGGGHSGGGGAGGRW